MASGAKTATVNASSVPSTQSNFPAYVDLSRVGITTLAEAQSARVYETSAKSTEYPREIVNATDMWVKITSLTSTATLYIEWDGISSDYAAGDTYGRNAVWSGFLAVYHLKYGSGTTAYDSTGSADGTISNSAIWATGAPFGNTNCVDFSVGNHYITALAPGSRTNYSIISWEYQPSGSTATHYNWGVWNGTTGRIYSYYDGGNSIGTRQLDREFRVTSALNQYTQTENAWYHKAVTSAQNTTNGLKSYINASVLDQANTANNANNTGAYNMALGALNNAGTYGSYGQNKMAEWKMTSSVLSADWITTEYNNQSDEATFWGTWSDVGGGAAFVPKVTMM